ncbi:protein kinase domain-containing protein [Actinocorallia populi]|uniref:protein kinase domain-containing protein n=1 Tax=Actinocorallia populi TaxID=2079200 RepID=UPI000D088B41|nr:protein kinase [Actinocorallia populi]
MQLLSGRYELLEPLGEGGMGTVYRARDRQLGRVVAVKTVRAEVRRTRDYRVRFEREARSAAGLNHPNITVVHDFGEDVLAGEAVPYLVMELLEGRTLAELVLREPPGADEAVRIVVAVLDALEHSHGRGLVHRDVKPSNIMIQDGEGRPEVKVMDFGIAKPVGRDTTRVTELGAAVGTPAYMSPEQARGEAVDERSDLYSAGCVLHELLTGRPPPGDGRPSPTRPGLDERWDGILATALARDPGKRYRTAAEMRTALLRARTAPETALDATARKGTSRRRFLFAGGCVVLASGGALVPRLRDGRTSLSGGGWRSLFMDADVQRILREEGFDVAVNDISGGEMASLRGRELDGYHFFLCPDEDTASEVEGSLRAAGHSPPKAGLVFHDRMVVLVHRALLDCLEEQRLVRDDRGYRIFDSAVYLDRRLAERDWTWGRIGGPVQHTQRDAQVEVVSGDPCETGGGNLYLSLLAHVYRTRLGLPEDEMAVRLEALFRNGWPESTFRLVREFFSGFPQYPMIFVYEHDALMYLDRRAREDPGFRPGDYTLLYPDPGVLSRHMFVGRKEAVRVGEVLVSPSSELQKVLARSFFLRGTDGGTLFEEAVRRRGLAGCIRPGGGGSLTAPNPSSTASFPGADSMAGLRRAVVGCSA